MDTMQVLPDEILWKQVCQECHNYLSVPPIVVNHKGETICGRCVGSIEHGQNTKSLFNIVANEFRFKCVNHFNGCTKVLAFDEVQSHEKECSYEPQECIFCSFTGNVSQIFNHAVKMHPENVSLDGIIPFPLSNHCLTKIVYLPIKDNHHLLIVRIELTEHLFRIVLNLVSKELPLNINQYPVKLYKPGDQESSTDYRLFSINLENTIEKPKEELVKIFGVANIHCQILMDTFTLEKKELELQKRIIDLRRSEERVVNLERELKTERADCQILMDTLERKELDLQRTTLGLRRSEEHVVNLERELEIKLNKQCEKYNFAMEVIQKILPSFFKCSKCQKITSADTFFCPRHHCYCKSCVSSFCGVCDGVREFKNLTGIEEFMVSCDWPGCEENIHIKNFWNHKIKCIFRPYKCPLQNCSETILSIKNLKEHWHAISPTLVECNEVICYKNKCEEYYWILNNDIYHLFINFDQNVIQISVEGYSVLQDALRFGCTTTSPYGRTCSKLDMLQFCGRYQVNATNQSGEINSIKVFCRN